MAALSTSDRSRVARGLMRYWSAQRETVAASSGSVNNNNACNFPTPTGSWGTITSVVVCDASTNGNLLWYGNDVVDQTVSTETTSIGFASGALVLTQT